MRGSANWSVHSGGPNFAYLLIPNWLINLERDPWNPFHKLERSVASKSDRRLLKQSNATQRFTIWLSLSERLIDRLNQRRLKQCELQLNGATLMACGIHRSE